MKYYYAARIETEGGATEIDGAQVVLAEDYDRLREALKIASLHLGKIADLTDGRTHEFVLLCKKDIDTAL